MPSAPGCCPGSVRPCRRGRLPGARIRAPRGQARQRSAWRAQVLEEAQARLQTVVRERLEEARGRRDHATILRFTRLFPQLGMPARACAKTRPAAPASHKRAQALFIRAPRRDPCAPVPPYQPPPCGVPWSAQAARTRGGGLHSRSRRAVRSACPRIAGGGPGVVCGVPAPAGHRARQGELQPARGERGCARPRAPGTDVSPP